MAAPANTTSCWAPMGSIPKSDGELADLGMDPIGAEHEVVLAGAAIVELDSHNPVFLSERPQRYTQPDCHGITMECQDFVQVGTMQGEARAYVAPHRGYVDVGQQVAAVVANALVWDQCRTFHHGGFEIKDTQRLRGVAREVDSSPARRPRGLPLDNVRGEPALSERPG